MPEKIHMICARMSRRAKIAATACLGALAATALGACGSQGNQVPVTSPYHHGAQLFRDHCSGCHTLAVVGAEGSATSVGDRMRTNGPNFNFRKEQPDQVLYAIRNGGFSGAIMPENLVVGQDAQDVANFLAKYSGLKVTPVVSAINSSSAPTQTAPTQPTHP